MQLKTSLYFFFLFSGLILPDSFKYNLINSNGVVGLINMPTARFYEESTTSFNYSYGEPDSKISLTLSPYSWLEGSIYYTSIKGRPYGGGFTQNYKDKGANIKVRLKKERNWPAIAIGLNDIGGTGISSSEFFVCSFGIGGLDLHLGVGWGKLSNGDYTFDNFMTNFEKSFEIRDSDVGRGGSLNLNDFFSGKEIGLFGGVSVLANKNMLLVYEYDSSNYSDTIGFSKNASNHSIGLSFVNLKNYSIGLSYERGEYIGLNMSIKQNFQKYEPNQYKKLNSKTNSKYNNLRYGLYKNNIGVNSIYKEENNIHIDVFENQYTTKSKLKEVISSAILDSGIDVEEVLTTYNTSGLIGMQDEGSARKGKKIYLRDKKSYTNISPNFVIRPFIAGREDFLKLATIGELDLTHVFNDHLSWTSNLKYAFLQNFDELYIPPVDTYPNQVRSDVKDYLNNFGNRLIIGRMQFDYFKTIYPNHHINVSAGIFEEMFAGYGFEYLWFDEKRNYSIGIESFDVQKRDYDLRFGLKDYRNTSSFINLYFVNDFLVPFDLHFSVGEYLAGDSGFTFDLSRKFKNGVVMGAFFTRTDVSEEQFGEGSFDKGLYFRIPLNGDWFRFAWRPLTKDPGAKLIRKSNLNDLLRKYRN